VNRSYLFAPGHNAKLLGKVFDVGADAVILDLEDAVPPEHKAAARHLVARALLSRPAWVRINAAGTPLAEADLHAIATPAYGIRIPKVESVQDVRWVADRAPGKPLICAIESAKGVANAIAIAAAPGVRYLALGGIDLQKDLGVASGDAPLQYARSHLVVAARAAGLEPPIDSVYPFLRDGEVFGAKPATAVRWGSSASPRSIRRSCRSFTPPSALMQTNCNGRGRSPRPSTMQTGLPCACQVESSSICPLRSGRAKFCDWLNRTHPDGCSDPRPPGSTASSHAPLESSCSTASSASTPMRVATR
jgi:citrate lyase subunit beta / citryl-CoA lyase